MEQLKKNRKALRTVVTRQVNELQINLEADTVNVNEIEASLEVLKKRFAELTTTDGNIYEILLADEKADEADLTKEIESCDEYSRKFHSVKSAVEKILKDDMDSAVSNQSRASGRTAVSAVGIQGRRTFKLPTIEFKKFDGNVKDWLPFWAQFKKVHDDEQIDEHDKIEYLVQATVQGSRARQIVDSYPAMAGNYQKMIDSLKDRFGRDDLQVEVYVRELLKLVLVNVTSHNKLDLSTLYDRIETQLRALDMLGITAAKCAPILFPLIESSIPQDLLRVWQRTPGAACGGTSVASSVVTGSAIDTTSVEIRLKNLLTFLRGEVESEQRVSLAAEGFGIGPSNRATKSESKGQVRTRSSTLKEVDNNITAAALVNCNLNKCVFCKGEHSSDTCFKAQKMTLEEKKTSLREKNACFSCLKIGHATKKCFSRLKCLLCTKSHVIIMCPKLLDYQKPVQKAEQKPEKPIEERQVTSSANQGLSNYSGNYVFLQTLRVNLETKDGLRSIRVLIDNGSQKSYILKDTAKLLMSEPKRTEKITHGLFGGSTVELLHKCYDIKLVRGSNSRTIEVLDQPTICQNIPSVFYGPWNAELDSLNVQISDVQTASPIEVLLGADVAGKLYTGNKRELDCGLDAFETIFGWTLMGRPHTSLSNLETTISCLVSDISTPDLWNLDILGISDPTEKRTRSEMALAAQQFFEETVKKDSTGRYEVRLPWIMDHPSLPSNYEICKKRLDTTLRRLQTNNLREEYEQVFEDWLAEGVIEEVLNDQTHQGHYLPHRPVIKENSTTKIRPVFDASACSKNSPSLNHCLEKGINLIERIPSIILRFRTFHIGVIADIKRAFLQIGVNEEDREFLKFLWIGQDNMERVYRHKRVVFGVNSSPFLLGATIEHHLKQSLVKCETSTVEYSKETVTKLSDSFYVDNCVTSVEDEDSLTSFIKEAKVVMAEAKMDLRGWESSGENKNEITDVVVLGLKWDKREDVLTVNMGNVVDILKPDTTITKRVMLSMAQRLFDPIGFTCPASLLPKLMLQGIWAKQVSWDEKVDEETADIFRNWIQELAFLNEIKIQRWIGFTTTSNQSWSVHTFCDASKDAFATAIFLRLEHEGQVFVQLLAAKTRVAPLKGLTIPRLELLAATIGARLYASTIENLRGSGESYFWSDSSTVVSWIKRKEEWSVFVSNRVREIRDLTSSDSWRHITGKFNPADLPSRGCSPKQLLISKWWEGPVWLHLSPKEWPKSIVEENEEEIGAERKKKLVRSMLNHGGSDEWHLNYFSKFTKLIRMVAWIQRLIYNLKNRQSVRRGELTTDECDRAEKFVLSIVQTESFREGTDRLKTLDTFRDENGLIRIKSSVSNRKDRYDFRYPIVLCGNHEVVKRLIYQTHIKSGHTGTQTLLTILRENYWILGGRRSIKAVISSCAVCKRQHGKPFVVESPVLPLNRVRDACVFEVAGVDFAGPLFLRDGSKAWICLFTCAVYRAIHLELVSSLSTSCFIQALRRFVARRGRPKTLYSDNGTNFTGTNNAFDRLDWDKIKQFATIERIDWKFNPPSAAWWGGFWERLIGVVKTILRKVLGRASLTFEHLSTVLCDCEAIINARPLTYLSNDPSDLAVLTPAMFLREQIADGVPDCDAVDRASLVRYVTYMQKLRDDLRRRFRSEYLGLLQRASHRTASRPIELGELVLIGNDVSKRLTWPLGRVVELIPGRDGATRIVRVKTADGLLLRPVQRLYPLELCWKEEEPLVGPNDEVPATVSARNNTGSAEKSAFKSRVPEPEASVVTTRSGRVLRKPIKYSV